jgi:hypothetical protein
LPSSFAAAVVIGLKIQTYFQEILTLIYPLLAFAGVIGFPGYNRCPLSIGCLFLVPITGILSALLVLKMEDNFGRYLPFSR